MTTTKTAGAMALAFAVMLVAAATAFGQNAEEMPQGMGPGMMGHMGPGMMGPGMGQGYGPGPGMMGPGMGHGYGPGPGMMGHMSSGMGHGHGPGPGMMGSGMGQGYGPGPGMMGSGMGHGYGPGPGMMGSGMGPGMGQGLGPGMMGQGLHPFRVVPTMELSTDDVRRFLARQISAHGLMHLQVGEVTQTDEDTITADVVTREGSLALRLEIDAYTGFVESVS
jgi:hypothetical protein